MKTNKPQRPRIGRPAPEGRKIQTCIRLTPDVSEFCRQHPEGFVVLESAIRRTAEFREWLKARKGGAK